MAAGFLQGYRAAGGSVPSDTRNLARLIDLVSLWTFLERASDHPMVYTEVKVVYTVRGRKMNKALVERAVSLSDEKYCSATAMIRKSAKVSHEVRLVEI